MQDNWSVKSEELLSSCPIWRSSMTLILFKFIYSKISILFPDNPGLSCLFTWFVLFERNVQDSLKSLETPWILQRLVTRLFQTISRTARNITVYLYIQFFWQFELESLCSTQQIQCSVWPTFKALYLLRKFSDCQIKPKYKVQSPFLCFRFWVKISI